MAAALTNELHPHGKARWPCATPVILRTKLDQLFRCAAAAVEFFHGYTYARLHAAGPGRSSTRKDPSHHPTRPIGADLNCGDPPTSAFVRDIRLAGLMAPRALAKPLRALRGAQAQACRTPPVKSNLD